jgi:phage FluMu protein Com
LKCPKCGDEMEHGYIITGSSSVSFHGAVTIELLSWKGDTSDDQEQLFRSIGGHGAIIRIEGYRCPACKIVAFSYDKTRHEFQEEAKAENYDYGDVEKYLR